MKKTGLFFVFVVLALAFHSTVFAQYVWTDERNVRHYSDMPPPSNIPAEKILKMPGNVIMQDHNSNFDQPDKKVSDKETDGKEADDQQPTLAEKIAEQNKKREEDAAAKKKAEEERKLAEEKRKNCERARTYERTLSSGKRVSYVNEKGEQVYMDDSSRTRELSDVRKAISDNCK